MEPTNPNNVKVTKYPPGPDNGVRFQLYQHEEFLGKPLNVNVPLPVELVVPNDRSITAIVLDSMRLAAEHLKVKTKNDNDNNT